MNAMMQVGTAAMVALMVAAVAETGGRRAAAAPPAPGLSTHPDSSTPPTVAIAPPVGPNAPGAVIDGSGVRLRSVGFELPASDRAFPPGPGADLLANNCQACHSAGMILNQPALTRAEWTGEVTKMIHVYKAPVSDEDAAGIVSYLASLKLAP